MKCELCGKNEGNIPLKRVEDGVVRDMMVCEECASQVGMDMQSPMNITDFLFGMNNPEDEEITGDDGRVCPACRMGGVDFAKLPLLGCPKCYETFEEELTSLLLVIHNENKHIGKVPENRRVLAEVSALQRALEKAIDAQDFEEAAKLRDRINGIMESQMVQGNGK